MMLQHQAHPVWSSADLETKLSGVCCAVVYMERCSALLQLPVNVCWPLPGAPWGPCLFCILFCMHARCWDGGMFGTVVGLWRSCVCDQRMSGWVDGFIEPLMCRHHTVLQHKHALLLVNTVLAALCLCSRAAWV